MSENLGIYNYSLPVELAFLVKVNTGHLKYFGARKNKVTSKTYNAQEEVMIDTF